MSKLKVGILREEKVPHDKRVAFTPEQCKWIMTTYPNADLVVQPSDWRAYKNAEYEQAGVPLKDDVSDRDLLIGIKEVPKPFLIPNKRYLFFSHTIKKQPHNRGMLKAV